MTKAKIARRLCFLGIVVFVECISIPALAQIQGPDLSFYGRQNSLLNYQQNQQQNDMQIQQLQQQINAQQLENAQRQQDLENQQRAQSAAAQQSSKMQTYVQSLNSIENQCYAKRNQGIYKSRQTTLKKCVVPQALNLAEQMQMPNTNALKGYFDYATQVSSKIDKREITEEEGKVLLNSYVQKHQ